MDGSSVAAPTQNADITSEDWTTSNTRCHQLHYCSLREREESRNLGPVRVPIQDALHRTVARCGNEAPREEQISIAPRYTREPVTALIPLNFAFLLPRL